MWFTAPTLDMFARSTALMYHILSVTDTGETPLALFQVVVPKAPYFKNFAKDSKVRGFLELDEIVEVQWGKTPSAF